MTNRNRIQITLFSLLIIAFGSLAVWLLLGCPETGIDDADIFFVYARNFASGHGFVYNIGGEFVEGFTSMLWTLVCAGISAVFRSPEKPLIILNILMGALVVGICLKRIERPWLFLLLLAAAPAWFAWCQITLMETGLWCLLITCSILAVAERRTQALAGLLPFLIITRPESMLWGAWLILILILTADKGQRKKVLLPAAAFILSLSVLIGFRLWYFGNPVPNTYYAKVSPDLISNIASGFIYLIRYFVSNPAVTFALIVSVIVLFKGGRGAGKPQRILLCLLPGIGIPVLVGGDHFGAFRFYQPLWPLLCLIISNADFSKLAEWLPKKILLVGLVLSGWVLFPLTANLKHEFRIAGEGRENGAALSQMFCDLETWPTVGVITAGGNKLGYPGYVYDLMGLNNTEMAHAPGGRTGVKNHTGFNRDVFYRWLPDILLCGDSSEFDARVLGGLHNDPQFQLLYTKCTLHRNGAELNAWYRSDFLMELPVQMQALPGE